MYPSQLYTCIGEAEEAINNETSLPDTRIAEDGSAIKDGTTLPDAAVVKNQAITENGIQGNLTRLGHS